MALTIRMRIDDHDEHSYYYATGDGTEIELIPLVVDENGVFIPDEGKAYNRVTVNVPTTELETLIATTNQTYNAPSGKAYNVVEVNVQPILEAVSRSFSSNGTYSVQPSEGYDGISTATIVVDVPNTYTAGDEGKVVQNGALVAQSSQNITANGTYDTTLKNEVNVNVPSSQPSLEHLVQSINADGTYTYNPSTGFDGFSDAVITVATGGGGGGSPDMVKGSFKADSAVDEFVINVPYTGSKLLKYIIIRAQGNPQDYNVNTYTQGTIIDLVVIKSTANAPNYTTATDNDNRAAFMRLYKSGATVIQGNGSGIVNTYLSDATTYPNSYGSATANNLHVRSNTKFSVATRDASSGSSRWGFDTSITYDYIVIYD